MARDSQLFGSSSRTRGRTGGGAVFRAEASVGSSSDADPLRRGAAVRSATLSARQSSVSTRQGSAAAAALSSASSMAAAASGSSSGSTSTSTAVTAKTAESSSVSAQKSDDAIVQSLRDALTAAGVNISGLGLIAHNDVEGYPGGTYVNRYISVSTPNGYAGLMTDLVGVDPKVAVLDIKRMLGQA
jgi:hypothetical protein